jgi:hypothetical protein
MESLVNGLGAEAEERFLAELRREFPAFRVISKRGNRLSTAIDRALRVLSFGKQDRYLTEYRTVLGDTLYVPESWNATKPVDRLICLRHERVHLRQRRRYGTVGMAVLYLFVPFPLGLAWFRARMEWEAYAETLRATSEWYGIEAVTHPSMREHILERFSGPDYLWMWPFRATVSRWYDEVVEELAGGASALPR